MSAPSRRDVFGLAGRVAALLAAGRLPLLAAAKLPPEVSPVQGYLAEHGPAEGRPPLSRLSYAVLRWTQSNPNTGETKNIEIGRLRIETAPADGGVLLKVRQRTSYSQPVNRLEAEALCRDDALLSLRSWQIKSWIEDRADSEFAARGEFDGELVRIDDGLRERKFAARAPLASLWSLPLACARNSAKAGRFQLLEDLLLYKPNQTLREAAALRVAYHNDEHTLRSWPHVGPGVLPIHYLVDEAGLPQLITQAALAWALQEVD